ncbi:MAG: hypothetical protein KKC80_04135 [Candidatus Margulisbacteria bacterium]|nr:hypothetical protein [Candidatus Margulisiibacteriota bacterium]MBU1616569.1 hypothetical protein [Candidatus Margulisiibacteriota bacterium]
MKTGMRRTLTIILILLFLSVSALAALTPQDQARLERMKSRIVNLTPEGRQEMIKFLQSRLFNLENGIGISEKTTKQERGEEVERIKAELDLLYTIPKAEAPIVIAEVTPEVIATPESIAAVPTPETPSVIAQIIEPEEVKPVRLTYDPTGPLPAELKHPSKPVEIAALPPKQEKAWAGKLAFAGGYFANLAALRGEWELPFNDIIFRVGSLYGSGSGNSHLMVFADTYYYLNPPETVGMRSYAGIGVNYPLVTSAGGQRSLGGELLYGGETPLGDGELFFEFGYGSIKAGTEQSGITALIGYRF